MLKDGEMQITHQGIAISKSNVLLDGQHRLLAIAHTGISAKMMITYDMPDTVFAVLDTGGKRTSSDVLSINGASNATTMAAGIRLYMLYNEVPHLTWTGSNPKILLSSTKINKEYHGDSLIWEWAASVARQSHTAKLISPGPMCCLVYLAHKHSNFSKSFIERFAMQLKEGDNLHALHPILAYRNKMIHASASTAQARLADFVKLFNACATGQSLKVFKSQAFPPMPSLIDSSESIFDNACA